MVTVWDVTHDHDHELMNQVNRRRNMSLISAKRINRNPNKHKPFRYDQKNLSVKE